MGRVEKAIIRVWADVPGALVVCGASGKLSRFWGWGKEVRGTEAEPGLEQEDGGDLVDDGGAGLAVAFGLVAGEVAAPAVLVEEGVGLGRGEALVEEVKAEVREVIAELGGEGLGLSGLRARLTGEMKRKADDHVGDEVFPDDSGDRLQVKVQGFAMQGEERLGGDAERIGEGEADAAVADVEREDAFVWGSGRVHRMSVRISVRRLDSAARVRS